jgi:hypothetical protein
MPDQLEWQTRLEVTVDGKVISPIDSFTPTFATPKTVIHSIEADNIGAVHQPQTATFTMSLKAIGASVATLTQIALDGKHFSISVAERRGTDWTFKKMLFRECLITSANPSNVVIDGVPTATFNGIILGFAAPSDREVQ